MKPTHSDNPIDVLRSEHQVILRVMNVLKHLVDRSECGDAFEREAFGTCVEFFRLFADACHHAKEEDLLFPVLESRGVPGEGGPIGVMLYEHRLARRFTQDMAEALDALARGAEEAEQRFRVAAHQYIDLLTNHINKEDSVLFNMGDRLMTTADRSTLCTQFCEVGCGRFGGRTCEDLERMAEELEEQWLN